MTDRLPRRLAGTGLWQALSAALAIAATPATAGTIDPDETVVLLPTVARHDAAEGVWRVPIHAWVFEVEEGSEWRAALVEAAAGLLDLGPEAPANALFRDRAWRFLVDNERGESIDLRIDDRIFTVGDTEPNGHLEAEVVLADGGLPPTEDRWLRLGVRLPPGDGRRFEGAVQLLAPEGLSVVSDIDDTVKISEVTDSRALLENTFLRPFRAVPGMPALYRRLSESGAAFHYVSSSPWQLVEPLREFLDAAGLPAGSFHLRQFRLKDEDFLTLFRESEQHKIPAIETLIRDHPDRRFVLIGDSGEQDPEIYGQVARRFPRQVVGILIRDVGGDPDIENRLAAAFAGLPPDRWLAFRDPAVIERLPLRR